MSTTVRWSSFAPPHPSNEDVLPLGRNFGNHIGVSLVFGYSLPELFTYAFTFVIAIVIEVITCYLIFVYLA